MAANYPFIDFFQRMSHELLADPSNEKFNKICRGYYKEYKGSKQCAYNMAKAMSKTFKFLDKEVSTNI
jgi:hypothetical protein